MKTKTPPKIDQQSLVDDDIARASDAASKVSGFTGEKKRPKGIPDAITWGEPPTDSGGSVEKVELDDEIPAAEQLIKGGVEAADTDRRKSAAGKQDHSRL